MSPIRNATRRHATKSFIACVLLFLTDVYSSNVAYAGGEKIWELAGHDEFARGEQIQTLLSSRGQIGLGLATEKIDLKALGLVWCAVTDENGVTYLGTGYNGEIFRIDGNKAQLIGTTDNIVVTDMVIDSAGNLLVATLPEPKIWKIETPHLIDPKKPSKAMPYASLAKDELVWSLALDKTSNILYAGTGPEGKIWAIEKDGRPNLFLDTEEKHILDILLTEKNSLFAGTSPNALLLKVTAPGTAFAIADFEGTEVKSIAQYQKNALVVGVNEFTSPRKSPTKKKNSVALSLKSTTSSAPAISRKLTKSNDKGTIFIVEYDGAHEALIEENGTHVVMVAVGNDNTIWGALGNDGKIISIDEDRVIHEVANLDEREVMWIQADDTLSFATTGDAGAAYRFKESNAEHAYVSPVLDAQNVSTFGKSSWLSKGTLSVTARSGNTVTPDKSWSQWSAPIQNGSKPALQAARYAQFKFTWKTKQTTLIGFELFYKPKNQRAVITKFNPDSPFTDTKGASKGSAGTSERIVAARPSGSNLQQLSLNWSVTNPDNDKLRYRLYYKPVQKSLWIPIFKEDYRYTATTYTWPTDTIPEGRYHFKLVADDSIENPLGESLSDEKISVPVNIDNHPPRVTKLRFKDGVVRGTVVDRFSSIGAIDYAVDGGMWFPVAAADGLLDSREETFSFTPFPTRMPGGHMIAVRGYDRNGNFSVKELHLEIAP